MKIPIQLRKQDSGGGLIIALFVIAVLAPIVAITLDFTTSQGLLARRGRDLQTTEAAAEAAMEVAFSKWKSWVKTNGGRIPLVANCAPTSTTNPVGINAALVQTYLNASQKFDGVTVTSLAIDPVDATEAPISGTLTDSDQKAAMRSMVPLDKFPRRIGRTYTYRVTATTTKAARGPNGAVTSTLTRYFRKSDATLWQAMMWFEGDLELFPSPEMTLFGWTHTNSNLYLAHANNTNNLRMKSDVSFQGSTTTINKGANSTLQDGNGLIYGVSYLQQFNEPGWADWKAPVWEGGGYDAQVSKVDRLDPLPVRREEAVNTTDADTNNDSLREIIERPTDTDANGKRTAADDNANFKDRRFYTMADIKIIINRTAAVADRVKILDKDDNRMTNQMATDIATLALAQNATTGLPSTKTLYDYREAGNITSSSASAAYAAQGDVTATNIDISKLTTILNNNLTTYANGVIYYKDETPNGTAGVSNKRAARLLKGGTLPSNGMTFVTEDGVYVQGDFNTGTTYNATTGATVTQPNSNSAGGNPLLNTVTGYTAKPCAVCADAVTFLSNSWSDAYSHSTATSGRVGSATTYNTAFMSGYIPTNTAYPTGSNVRSGGAINFPRVMENWNASALTYHGSMVQIFNSTVFTTPWVPSVYGAATRRWYFQTSFIDSPPPGPLEFTLYDRGRFSRSAL